MRVLIVKVSSLGDIIHTLPAVTDASRAKRDLVFDWVVEEGFTEIPAWHPAVNKVIPVAFRRWRKQPWDTWLSGEFGDFKQNLQEVHYDLVLDAQGLIKSGIISRIAKGLTVGLSNHTIREPLATLFYNVVYTVPWQQHAVQRVRELFSRTFNYPVDYGNCDYGIDKSRFLSDVPTGMGADENYVVFLHGTTWDSKKWPETYWQELARIAAANGLRIKLLWGNQEELERARGIASATAEARVLDKLNISQIASVLAGASGIVSVDTGLAHLAAALGVPCVSIYGASNHELTGTFGNNQAHLNATLSCAPCLEKTCQYQGNPITDNVAGSIIAVDPPCYAENPPARVWGRLRGMMTCTQSASSGKSGIIARAD